MNATACGLYHAPQGGDKHEGTVGLPAPSDDRAHVRNHGMWQAEDVPIRSIKRVSSYAGYEEDTCAKGGLLCLDAFADATGRRGRC